MTTPTQAQIQALTECMEDLETEINSRYKDSAGDVHPALVHRYERDMRTVKNASEVITALTAAAEVGEPTADDVRGILKPDWLHPPTIERCAAAIRALKD